MIGLVLTSWLLAGAGDVEGAEPMDHPSVMFCAALHASKPADGAALQ
jgi:hypothetical protein